LLTSPPGLIRARALTGFAELAARHGGDAPALLAGAGLPPRLMDDPDGPLPLDRMALLLHNSAALLGVPDFGLQLAASRDIGVLGPVALLARHAATVGDACAAIVRHMPYHAPGARLTIEADPDRAGHTRIRFEARLGAGVPAGQIIELWLGMAQNFLRPLTQDGGAGWSAAFRHDSNLPAAGYRRYFSGAVLARQAYDGLSLPSALMAREVAPGNGLLQHAAERFVSNVIRRYPLDIVQQVEALVERDLASGGGSLVQVARLLGLHERTLQRRLRHHGVFFEDIVDRLRRARAEEFLSHPAIPLAQVASLLGYTEQSSFIRVCKRWFATTPQVYRDRCSGARPMAMAAGAPQAISGCGSPSR
jgi:AraC-like DNA-binding protein